MLEVIILFLLCKDLGRVVRHDGRRPLGYQCLLVSLWFVGEAVGVAVGVTLVPESGMQVYGLGLVPYLVGLVCAIAASVMVFKFSRSTAPAPRPSRFSVMPTQSAITFDDRLE